MIPKEDLRWYLFEETIEMFSKNGVNNYENHRYKDLNRFLSDYYIIKSVGIASKAIYKLSNVFNKQDNDILVHDLLYKYPRIIRQLELNYNPLFFGINIKPFFKSLRRKINYYPLYDVYKDLYKGVLNYDDDQLMDSFQNLKSIVKKINPKLIILNHDFTTETRMIALVARELGVPTVEIQHGLYSGKKKIFTGKYVDYVFVWGEFFKNLYLKSELKQGSAIKVLGYPYPVIQHKNNKYNKKVVYLGQTVELYGDSFFNTKKDTIKGLNVLCEELGFEFIYRQHPSENLDSLKSFLNGVRFCPENEKLGETIKNNDIFISFNSTALIESALNSKMSVQLINYDIPTDDFEELGICRSFTDLKELKDFLKELKTYDDLKRYYTPVDPDYIEIPSPNPGAKFVELIKEIV